MIVFNRTISRMCWHHSLRKNIWWALGNGLFSSFLIIHLQKENTIPFIDVIFFFSFILTSLESLPMTTLWHYGLHFMYYFLLFLFFDKPRKFKLLPVISNQLPATHCNQFFIFKKIFPQFAFLNFEYSKPSLLGHTWWSLICCSKLSRSPCVSLKLPYCTYMTSINAKWLPAAVPRDNLTFLGYIIQSYKRNFGLQLAITMVKLEIQRKYKKNPL